MFADQINHACAKFPDNNTERFLLYPALAVYSPIENLVRTAVGVVFTALSLLTLGLCQPINDAANWTRYSRGILTIPLEIIGNIFKLHSAILQKYNLDTPKLISDINTAINIANEHSQDVTIENINIKIAKIEVELAEKLKNKPEYFADVKLTKAQNVCTIVFQNRTDSKIQLLAKHIIFRLNILVDTVFFTLIFTIISPVVSLISLPYALYNRGKDKTTNNLVFMAPKIPELIHNVCLSLRMIVNPLQFVRETSQELQVDTKPKMNALHAAKYFWKNTLEM